MSDIDNTSSYAFNNEQLIFVELLEKYKILLESGTKRSRKMVRARRRAATALAAEYNEKCLKNITMQKVITKIRNLKARLKAKNYKNLRISHKLEYLDSEKKFLDMWVGSDISLLKKKSRKRSKFKIQPENNLSGGISVSEKRSDDANDSIDDANDVGVQTENGTPECITFEMEKPDKSNSSSDVAVEPENCSPKGIMMDADDSNFQDSAEISIGSSEHLTEVNLESETRFEHEEYNEEHDKYEFMTLSKLKHVALIAQIKALKEQEAASKAKKELSIYKLSILKRNSGKKPPKNACGVINKRANKRQAEIMCDDKEDDLRVVTYTETVIKRRKSEREIKTRFCDTKNDEELAMDELRRAVLILQLKALEAQEAALKPRRN